MTTLLLLRHGETDAVGKAIMGLAPGWHLNPAGKAQAQKLAEKLARFPVRAVYTSPLERARETAAPIASRHKLEALLSSEIGEMDPGAWMGQQISDLEKRDDFRRFNVFRSATRPPGGEVMLECQTRMVRKIEEIRQKHDGELVVLVSHGDPIRSVLTYFLGMPLDLCLRLEVHPASISTLELTEWSARVLCVNETGDVPL